ncbi:MAG: flagellin [Candidatus Verstraetearchaeota archaeon]|nr:flagellin [Candidatus Verstraetearchaeota archaeon]
MLVRRSRKGIVGIEAAIVLIAFVIVAAALAFVIINMGMFTTQKSKEVMQQGLNEATTALEVDGTVLGYCRNATPVNVTYIYIPLKVSPGQLAVDFAKEKIDVVVKLPKGTFSKVNTLNPVKVSQTPINYTELQPILKNAKVNATVYIIQGDDDTVLEVGEKYIVVIALDRSVALNVYDKFTVEIKPLQGAPLVVERTVPPTLTAGEFVSLG